MSIHHILTPFTTVLIIRTLSTIDVSTVNFKAFTLIKSSLLKSALALIQNKNSRLDSSGEKYDHQYNQNVSASSYTSHYVTADLQNWTPSHKNLLGIFVMTVRTSSYKSTFKLFYFKHSNHGITRRSGNNARRTMAWMHCTGGTILKYC